MEMQGGDTRGLGITVQCQDHASIASSALLSSTPQPAGGRAFLCPPMAPAHSVIILCLQESLLQGSVKRGERAPQFSLLYFPGIP